MAFFVRPLTVDEKKRIIALKTQYAENPALLTRLDIILLSSQRLKSGKIANELQVGRATAIRWIQHFNESGLDCFSQYIPLGNSSNVATHHKLEENFAVRNLSQIEIERIESLLQEYRDSAGTLKHLQTIILSNRGLTLTEIANTIGFSRRTYWRVRSWIEQFNEQGLASLETPSDKNWRKQKQKT
jgi:transposase